jgi:hypothetical protein
MKLRSQPNNWSCLLTSFGIVLDVQDSKLIELIGHDGSEIIYPDNPEPHNHRGFHIQEMIMAAYKLGFMVTPFEPRASLREVHKFRSIVIEQDIESILWANTGVLTGMNKFNQRHAIAWDGIRVYDPGGLIIKTLEDFQIECFWTVNYYGIQ